MTFTRRAILPALALRRAGLRPGRVQQAAAGAPRLHLGDYIKPELIKQFEAETGARVVIDTFDSNEAMYAKIKAAPRATT